MVEYVGPNPSVALGQYKATPPTVADGQTVQLQVDVNGNLKTTGGGGGGGDSNITEIAGTAVNAAAAATGALPVTLMPTTGTTTVTSAAVFKTVAATGTPERVAASTLLVSSVVFQGYKAQGTVNVGSVFMGMTSADGTQPITLVSGGTIALTASPGKFWDLNLIYIDAANNGDGVGYWYEV